MKKLVIVVVVLGVLVGGVAWAFTRKPERRLCVRVGELCGAEASLGDYEQCVDEMERLSKVVGEEPFENAAECVDDADSCVQAMGCVTGAGYRALPKLAEEFFKGFNDAQR
jgi:hypothetical protein